MRSSRVDEILLSGWDLAEWFKRLTSKTRVATALGSIPAPSHSGIWGAADEAVMNQVHEKIQIQD